MKRSGSCAPVSLAVSKTPCDLLTRDLPPMPFSYVTNPISAANPTVRLWRKPANVSDWILAAFRYRTFAERRETGCAAMRRASRAAAGLIGRPCKPVRIDFDTPTGRLGHMGLARADRV